VYIGHAEAATAATRHVLSPAVHIANRHRHYIAGLHYVLTRQSLAIDDEV
jgi:hypothetical protein